MFNQESQMPENLQGHNEVAAQMSGPESANPQPSVDNTDRFGLAAAGKSYLLRRFNVQISAAGNPYFTPIDSILKGLIRDAEDVLALARSQFGNDEDRVANAEKQAEAALLYFEACSDVAGEGREWIARKRVIWPLNDDLGYQLYKATSGLEDLADFGAYLVRTDNNIESISDAQNDERYQKREFWSNLALAEIGELDNIIQAIENTEYNLDAMVANGYRNQARMDTTNHLRGVRENVPAVDDNDVRAQLKAQLMAQAV